VLALLSHTARAQSDRVDVVFSTNQTTQFGQSIYVLGDLPELGAGDIRRAVKLEPSAYPLWRAVISLPVNTTYTFQFYRRADDAASVGLITNGTALGTLTTASTPTVSLQPPRKAIAFMSSWASPSVQWRVGSTGTFTRVQALDMGAGRTTSERRWLALVSAPPRARIEWFVEPTLQEGPTQLREPTTGFYTTSLDACFVQDAQLFAYAPPASVSAPFRAYSTSAIPAIDSTNLNNERRQYRVWLPRGYTQNTTKRYPVLYMHDGQNIFEPGPFGTWNADTAAAQQMSKGDMRETIIVGIDNTASRFIDYVPPGDLTPNAQAGQADRYARFIVQELKPLIDSTYRTLPDAQSTGTMGSSMGGQVSMYLGWDWTSSFTRIGALSNYWSTNFRSRITSNAKPAIKLSMDSGSAGAANDNFSPTFAVRDNFNVATRAGGPFVLERDFRHVIGIGQQHNEAAWATRVGPAMSFLFPASEEPSNVLAFATLDAFDANADQRLAHNDIYASAASPTDTNRSGAASHDDTRAIASVIRRSEREALLRR
jgi:predicted alpha/beta superfamily hydrolase